MIIIPSHLSYNDTNLKATNVAVMFNFSPISFARNLPQLSKTPYDVQHNVTY